MVKPTWKYWGLIDINGNYVLDPICHYIDHWSEGVLLLTKESSTSSKKWESYHNGQYGFINAAGKMITDFSFGNARDFSSGLAAVNKNKKWGFIDRSGKLVIPFEFKEIIEFGEDGCVVQKGGKWGLIDRSGAWKLPNTFKNLSRFAFGLAIAKKTSGLIFKNEYSFVVDTKGNKIVDLPKDWAWFKPVSEKLILVGTTSGYPGDRTFGFMDLTGKIITPPQFYTSSDYGFETGEFSEGMLIVRNKNGLFGFVNEAGELEIPLQFQSAEPFKNGIAKVSLDSKTFYIDKAGITVKYNEPEETKRPFDEVLGYSEGLAVARKGELWGVIDENNNVVVDFKYGKRWLRTEGDKGLYFTEKYPKYSCGLIGVNNETATGVHAGYLDKEGKIAIDLKYRVANPFVLN